MNCKADFAKLNKRQSAKRRIALVVCVLFIAGTLFSTAFISTRINHDHDGHNGNCTTCAHLAMAERLLKSLSTAITDTALIFGCFSVICSILKAVDFYTGFITLVHLKVRLNN